MRFTEKRWKAVFRFKGVYNCVASLVFLLFDDAFRRLLGAPPTDETYRALFLGLAFVFGLGYWRVGADLSVNHDIVRMGVLGQIIVFAVLLRAVAIGEPRLPWPFLLPGVVDLIFGFAYISFLINFAPLTKYLSLKGEVERLGDRAPEPPTERAAAAVDLGEASEAGLK